jgi:hypothetical protein
MLRAGKLLSACWVALALLAWGCVTPARESAPATTTVGARLTPAASLTAPVVEQQAIAALAARVDLLRVQRSRHLALFLEKRGHYGEDDSADRQWRTSLAAVDERLTEFLEGHPALHPASAERLERCVLGPLQALRATDDQ